MHKIKKITTRFLFEIMNYVPDSGYLILAFRGNGIWVDVPVQKREKWRATIRAALSKYPADQFDVYYCPHPFLQPRRLRKHALPTHYCHSDVDDGEATNVMPKPTIIIQSSPGRTQALWRFTTAMSVDEAEQRSKYLTALCSGDTGCHSITKVLRVPGTINHKPTYSLPRVKVLEWNDEACQWPKGIDLPTLSAAATESASIAIVGIDHLDAYEQCRLRVPVMARRLIRHKRVLATDRSWAIFMIVAGLHRAGASPSEIAAVLFHTVYFRSKYGTSSDRLFEEVTRILSKLEVE